MIDNDLILQTFKDNEPLLQSMRAVMLNIGVTQEDRDVVTTVFKSDELFDMVAGAFLPRFEHNAPIGKFQDAWDGADNMMMGAGRDQIKQVFGYKKLAIEWMQKATAALRDPNSNDLNLQDVDTEGDELGIELLARNKFINTVDKQLTIFWVLSQQTEEKKQEMAQRLVADSAR